MFGKNYDKDIIKLNEDLDEVLELLDRNIKSQIEEYKYIKERIDEMEKLIIEVSKVQKSHKQAIMILSKRD